MRRFHQYLGLLMLLPFMVWAITGVFFFIKPGYQEAYAQLTVKTYPLEKNYYLKSQPNWQQVRLIRSILGDHLLVKIDNQWQQIDLKSYAILDAPNDSEIRRLVNDAISISPERYGEIKSIDDTTVTMTKGVTINLDWQQMTLRQRGEDTDFINWMYKMHYLQWTGVQWLDRILGVVGLGLVVLLAVIGVVMMVKRSMLRSKR
jgi:hypothetical protein